MTSQRASAGMGRRGVWILAGVLGLGLAPLLSSCSQATPAEPVAVSPTPALINALPGDYVGKQVAVSGQVKYVQGPGVYVIGPMTPPAQVRPYSRDNQILVITRTPPDRPVKMGDYISVTGIVQPFTPEMGLGPQFGPAFGVGGPEVNPQFYDTWRNRPAVVADIIKHLEYSAPPRG